MICWVPISGQAAKEHGNLKTKKRWKYYTLETFHPPYDGWEPREQTEAVNCSAEHTRPDSLLTNWLKLVKFLLHWVKESGTASRQASGNRIMEVLDRFWFFKKKLKLIQMHVEDCTRNKVPEMLGHWVYSYSSIASVCPFPKAMHSLNTTHFPHNIGLIVEVFSIQSMTSCM